MHGFQKGPRSLAKRFGPGKILWVPRRCHIGQSKVALLIQRRQMGHVVGRHQFGNLIHRRGKPLPRVYSDAVVGEGDVWDVGVAARHVAGRAVVRGVLLEPLGTIQLTSLRGVTVQAFLSVEGDRVFRFLLACGSWQVRQVRRSDFW